MTMLLTEIHAMRAADVHLVQHLNGLFDESRDAVYWHHRQDISEGRRRVAFYLYHKLVEVIIGVITVSNFLFIIMDADFAAAGESTPRWLEFSILGCFSMYFVELVLHFYVERKEIFDSYWNWLDICVVLFGIIEILSGFIGYHTVPLQFIRIFRCLRLLRVFKAFAFFAILKELQLIVRGFIACVRTLIWSFLLTFIFMTSWSVVAVELIHPVMDSVANTGVWKDCDRCSRSFASVMHANLTFFQTIVAGDSWGKVAIPVMEMYPWTSVIWIGSLFTLVFGMLNLIIAVLVDSAADARARDTEARAKDADVIANAEKKALEIIFNKIDLDADGALTFEELKCGAMDVPEFKDRLKVMAIDHTDLQHLFVMCDEDGDGEVSVVEFIETLYRLKCSDHAISATFTKHYLGHLEKIQKQLDYKVDMLLENCRPSGVKGHNRHAVRDFTHEDYETDIRNLNNFKGEWTAFMIGDPEAGERRLKAMGGFMKDRDAPNTDDASNHSGGGSTSDLSNAPKKFRSGRSNGSRDNKDPGSRAGSKESEHSVLRSNGQGCYESRKPYGSADNEALSLLIVPHGTSPPRIALPRIATPRSPGSGVDAWSSHGAHAPVLITPRQIPSPQNDVHDCNLVKLEENLS